MTASLTLPIDAHVPKIQAALRDGRTAIIKAAPGAGKTTRVPPALLDVVQGRIVVLEPRRLAARLSAERVAAELGESVGATVGYQVRFDAKVSDATRVVFVTEGLFLRMALDRPTLPGIGALILDEFHERHVHTDLALAVARKLQATSRPDLKLLVMSATLDTAALESYLPEAKVFDVEGRAFPVTIEHQAPPEGQDVERSASEAALRALADPRCPGNVLVFLTGIQEIRNTADLLARLAPANVDVLPLSAEIPPREQARVFEETGRRKIVLATNVAETSLTLPGITGVVDTGRAKIAGHASWSGMPTLDVKRVSQASCIQRSGRAGRTAPGLALRLYSETDFRGRAPFNIPDIRRLDFAETYLDVLALTKGLGDGATIEAALPWFDPPEAKAVASARQLLTYLGALDAEGRLTDRGARFARIPLHPRLAAVIVKGQEIDALRQALLAACLISERMILGRTRGPIAVEESDVAFQMDVILRIARRQDVTPEALRQSVDFARARQVLNLYDNLARRLQINGLPDDVDADAAARCLLAGFPDRVAVKREIPVAERGHREQHLFNFCLGRGGLLADTSVVKKAPLIVVIDASETAARSADRGTSIWVAAAVTPEQLKEAPAGLLSSRREVIWSDDAERVDVFQRTFYGEVVTSESRAAVADEDATEVETLLAKKLTERWPKPFPDDGDLTAYHVRAELLMTRHPDLGLPRFEGEMLELLIGTICEGKRSFRQIAERRLLAYIEDQLPYDLQMKLREQTPLEIKLSNGRHLKVTYEPGRPPNISGYIQDFYGIKTTPALLGGAIPLTVHLLGPNKRPLQVTSDLAGFWKRGYVDMLSELSRNYPRHFWPDDPTTAEPHLHKARVKR